MADIEQILMKHKLQAREIQATEDTAQVKQALELANDTELSEDLSTISQKDKVAWNKKVLQRIDGNYQSMLAVRSGANGAIDSGVPGIITQVQDAYRLHKQYGTSAHVTNVYHLHYHQDTDTSKAHLEVLSNYVFYNPHMHALDLMLEAYGFNG